MVTRAQPVPMADEKFSAVQVPSNRIHVDNGIEFLGEIITLPEVVVAHEIVDGNARIRKFGQLALQAHIAFGDHPFVLKPKIKQVSDQVQFGAITLDLV